MEIINEISKQINIYYNNNNHLKYYKNYNNLEKKIIYQKL
jgi:hypothetical protein